ncbi:MAG: hypothetical protein HQ582_04165 [Planctomycetes bacterium]|nr:hypothetical protein [Planctomycetota bacterium]
MAKAKRAKKSTPTFRELADQLEKRCKASNFSVERGVDEEGDPFARVEVPNGRETRSFYLWQGPRISEFLSASFEKYVFLGDYVAIASFDDSYIEAMLQSRTPGPSSVVWRAFGVSPKDENASETPVRIVDEDFAPGCEITVGECSDDMFGLRTGPGILRDSRRWSLQISGVRISTHDEALGVLERLSNSLFFQIDLSRGAALSLQRERRRQRALRTPRRDASEEYDIQFPKVEYDDAPITLYWYARSATGMPLLQFLAFYQCVEYYYPTFSQSEARRRIRQVLKDPTFRADRDTDLTRVLTSLGTGSRGITDERSMLRSTIRECISETEIRQYFEGSEDRKRFFSAKARGLTDCKIPVGNSGADLRGAVADRIYDLRCKIVHTKTGPGDDSVELLLPYSKGEQLLVHDIALLRFVAQQVLIAGSSDLRL